MLTRSLIGHTSSLKRLQAFIDSSVQTILLTGPLSVGKSTLARSIDAENLEYAGTLTMRDIRHLQSVCSTTPLSRFRVVLLRDVDRWSKEVANAALKMLEEPRKGTVFILTTAFVDTVLPTVRSRCVEMRVPFFTRAEMESLYAELNLPSDTKKEWRLIVADGRPGRLVSYAGSIDVQDLWDQAESAYLVLRDKTVSDAFLLAKSLGATSKQTSSQDVRAKLRSYSYVWEARCAHDARIDRLQRRIWLMALSEFRSYIEANIQPQRAIEWLAIEICNT